MPMNFPTMDSLKMAAECHRFRQPHAGESEADYRKALADHVQPRDLIESMEIRTSVGWDQFSDAQNTEMLLRGLHR